MPTPRLQEGEKKIIFEMHRKRKMSPAEIAKSLGRNKSTITRLLYRKPSMRRVGRPALLTKTQVDNIVKRLDQMIAEGKGQITCAMLKKRTKCKASTRVIFNALHKRKIYFHPLREKPTLTDDDRKDRLAFAKKFKDRPKKFFLQNIHACMDNKYFPVLLSERARVAAAQQRVRGAFRTRGGGYGKGYIKPPKKMKTNTGSPSAIISAAIGNGKVIMWHEVKPQKPGKTSTKKAVKKGKPKAVWNAEEAAFMYRNPLLKGLKANYPNKRKFWVLEDNDPSGYKSKKAKVAKEEIGIGAFEIPKRSPDLNPLDYAVWNEVNSKMRKAEQRFPKTKKETRGQYLNRLRRTAKGLSATFINGSIGSLKKRLGQVFAAKGGHFREGS